MYKVEDQKFVGLSNTFEEYNHEISHMEKVFVELIEFMEISSDAAVLVKAQDVSEFIRRSFS